MQINLIVITFNNWKWKSKTIIAKRIIGSKIGNIRSQKLVTRKPTENSAIEGWNIITLNSNLAGRTINQQ